MQRLTIECLPCEILEHIFLEAREVNLARASRTIAAAVSQESIYDVFMINAFWNDPQDCFRRRHFDREYTYMNLRFSKTDYHDSWLFQRKLRPGRYQPLRIEDQKSLQRSVISCQWFNVHRFQRIFPTLLALTLEALRLQERCRIPMAGHQPLQPTASSKLAPYHVGDHVTTDGYPKRLRVVDNFAIQATYQTIAHGKSHIIRTARILVLPDKILRGPWDTDRISLLVNLRRAFGKRLGPFVSNVERSIQSTITPVFCDHACLQGIEAAIRQNSRVALMYLMDIREGFQSSCTHGTQKVPLPNHLVTTAIENDTIDSDILCFLIRAQISAVRSRSEVIERAKLAILQSSLGARWLWSYLRGQTSCLSGIKLWNAICRFQVLADPLLASETWV